MNARDTLVKRCGSIGFAVGCGSEPRNAARVQLHSHTGRNGSRRRRSPLRRAWERRTRYWSFARRARPSSRNSSCAIPGEGPIAQVRSGLRALTFAIEVRIAIRIYEMAAKETRSSDQVRNQTGDPFGFKHWASYDATIITEGRVAGSRFNEVAAITWVCRTV
jgi:hypothetical protein